MARRSRGRGRLSKIDLLPDYARVDVDWAIGELNACTRDAEEIRLEFNERLMEKGIKGIKRSSFGRYSLKLSRHSRAMKEVRAAARVWAERMEAEPEGDVGLLIGETIKILVYEAISDVPLDAAGGSLEMLGKAALTLQRLERARGTNYATAVLKRDKFLKTVSDDVEERMREKGMSKETVDNVTALILGVPTEEDAPKGSADP